MSLTNLVHLIIEHVPDHYLLLIDTTEKLMKIPNGDGLIRCHIELS